MSYIYTLLDIVSSLLILVTFTFAVSVKDNKANKKRECEEITENEIIILSKCNNIFWANLSYNPHAVELLKKRFEYEKSLSEEEYNRLPFCNKIDWVIICMNENAIELIKKRIEYENYLGYNYKFQDCIDSSYGENRINWTTMTSNKNAIELLRDRIKYEKSLYNLDIKEYNKLVNKINWKSGLTSTKNAVILLKYLLKEYGDNFTILSFLFEDSKFNITKSKSIVKKHTDIKII
jgi:hypothetical protein